MSTMYEVTEALTKLSSFQVAINATLKRIINREMDSDMSLGIHTVAINAIKTSERLAFLLEQLVNRVAKEYETQDAVQEAMEEFKYA